MKTRLLLLTILVSAAFYTHAAENQPLKIGYVKLDYVMGNLPDTKQAEADLKAFATQLGIQLQSKATLLQEEYESLSKGGATMAEEAKKKKQANLHRLQVDFENSQREYQISIENKQIELIIPIREKIQQKIEEIVREQKYDYIFNTSVGTESDIVLYGKSEFDISNLVLTKLGVNPLASVQTKQATTRAGKQDKKAIKKGDKAKK